MLLKLMVLDINKLTNLNLSPSRWYKTIFFPVPVKAPKSLLNRQQFKAFPISILLDEFNTPANHIGQDKFEFSNRVIRICQFDSFIFTTFTISFRNGCYRTTFIVLFEVFLMIMDKIMHANIAEIKENLDKIFVLL